MTLKRILVLPKTVYTIALHAFEEETEKKQQILHGNRLIKN